MDCFKLLGIQPTKDIKIIKRAYAKMLKVCSPEEDPSGFQELRNAYEEALERANEADDFSQDLLSPVDDFMVKFEEYYADFQKRIDSSLWKELLERDVCYNIDTSQEINNKILRFIMEHYNFPHEVWVLFNSYFSWSTKKEKLYQEFPQNFIDFIVYRATQKDFFRYDYLLNCGDRQEAFIEAYKQGCRALEEYDLYHTQKHIDEATEISPDHPDLLVLTARYLMTNGQIAEAHTLLSDSINKNDEDLNAVIHRGHLFFRMGKFQDAYDDYKKANTIDPESTDLLFPLGKCCISLGKYEEAIEHLQRLRDKLPYNREVWILLNSAYCFLIDELAAQSVMNPEDTEIQYRLAEAYWGNKKLEESYELLISLQEKNRLDTKTYVLLCKVLLRLNKKELAYSTVCKALELFPKEHELVFYKACILDELGEYEEAIFYYDRAIDLDPEDATSYNNKAHLQNRLKRYNEALDNVQQAIKLASNNAHAYKNKGEALLGLQLYEDSLAACEEALTIYPYLVDAYVIKMKLFAAVNQYDNALNTFRNAMDLGLKDTRLYYEKGNVLYLNERYEEAVYACDQALELDENNQEACYCKGLCYYYQDNYEQAVHCFDQAIEKDGLYEQAYYYKALCLSEDEKREEALIEIEKAIQLDSEHVDRSHKLKGSILFNLERYWEAVEAFKKAIEKNPTCASYYYNVGYTLNDRLEEYEQSLSYFDKSIELDPSVIGAYICKSHSYYNLSEYEKCIEQCDIALELDPEVLNGHRNRAWAFYELGQLEEAEKSCSRGLKIDGNFENLLGLKLNILRRKEQYRDALIAADRYLEICPDDMDIMKIREELIQKIDKPKKGLFNLLSGKSG